MGESKVKSENFITIQGFMVKDLNLKGNELLIYAIVYGFSQADNQVFSGSLQYLADWTNSTKQGVQKNLKSLVEKGLLGKNDKIINGVKFCEYYATKFNGVYNKVAGGIQQSCIGYTTELHRGIQQSCTNNIDIYNIENNIEDNIVNNKVSNRQLEEEFEIIWEEYPKKQGKANALKSYIKARKKGTTKEEVWSGLGAYLEYIQIEKVSPQYIKHGSTWFNQECWSDDYSIRRQATTKDLAENMDFSEFR